MSFTNLIFPAFLLITVVLYYLLPKRFNIWLLLAASWFFYAYNNLLVFLLLPATTVLTYFSARIIETNEQTAVKKSVFIVTLIICFGALVVFKYLGFFADTAISIAKLFGAKTDSVALKIILPVGISFYTFQTVSYVIDVYLKKSKAERNFCYYAVFVSFFPQLVAGPIERYGDLMPQLKEKHAYDADNVKCGLAMILCGFVKKVVVADTLAIIVNPVFNGSDISQTTALSVAIASALFFVQVYCDFSGYSDIAIGCARLIGIKLTKNFNRPFIAKSVTEFWSRWHITLSRWFGEYVYLPLAFKTRKRKPKILYHCLNTLLVMLLCGLWHGANWSFVLWGAMLGLMQIAERLLSAPFKKFCERHKINSEAGICGWLRRILTFCFLTLTMILFRANSFSDALTMYARLFTGWNVHDLFTVTALQTSLDIWLVIIVALCIFITSTVDRMISDDAGVSVTVGKNSSAFWFVAVIAFWCILLAAALQTANGQLSTFIYFQF